MNISATIKAVGEIVIEYGKARSNATPLQLIDWSGNLAGYLYFLATEMENERSAMDKHYFDLRAGGMSAKDAELKARVDCPMYRHLDRLVSQGNKVFESMRSHLSYLKMEQNQTL